VGLERAWGSARVPTTSEVLLEGLVARSSRRGERAVPPGPDGLVRRPPERDPPTGAGFLLWGGTRQWRDPFPRRHVQFEGPVRLRMVNFRAVNSRIAPGISPGLAIAATLIVLLATVASLASLPAPKTAGGAPLPAYASHRAIASVDRLRWPTYADPASAALAISSFTANPSSVLWQSGGVALTVTTVGGTPPLAYAYSGLPPGCVTANSPSISCESDRSGTFTIRVNVTDSAGGRATANASFTVDPSVFGLSEGTFWVVLGVATVGTIGGAAFYVMRRNRQKDNWEET
jgi:hypothetical protein